jgi:hypothetical protein
MGESGLVVAAEALPLLPAMGTEVVVQDGGGWRKAGTKARSGKSLGRASYQSGR